MVEEESIISIPISAIPFFVHEENNKLFHLDCNHRSVLSKEMISKNNDSNLISVFYGNSNILHNSQLDIFLNTVSFTKYSKSML